MQKSLYIAEKPSVAREFAKALKLDMKRHDGYQESEEAVVTWCVGHLVTMSYPEAYDIKYKKWSLETLPFIPKKFKYEVISGVSKQFQTVSKLLNRPDVDVVYVCTDSGREGEYIYRLVEQMAHVHGKTRKRVWIDSQTEDEILRGIREAKDLSAYDNLAASAYLRAKEDYLMGINFSRLLTLKYGNTIAAFLKKKYSVVSVGRVMTCVLGMVVRREREIRDFVKTPFYRVLAAVMPENEAVSGEWRAVEESAWYRSPRLYKENGYLKKEDAQTLIEKLNQDYARSGATVKKLEKKKENKKPPLLYNLAELQNECSRFFKISPDETLRIVQELYEKKLVTYPRTDARVLSSAVAKEITRNLNGLQGIQMVQPFVRAVLEQGSYKNLAKTRYVDDKQITDHYAIIPTGQGISAMKSLSQAALRVYEVVVRRFLAIFYPPAVYQRMMLEVAVGKEHFFANFKALQQPGYLQVMEYTFFKKKPQAAKGVDENGQDEARSGMDGSGQQGAAQVSCDTELFAAVSRLKKGDAIKIAGFSIKEGETTPPKRYHSGSMILAMENAGQLIEDEELRSQIKSCGIGTSATRAEILKKLVGNRYLQLNKKTQVITPTLLGEMVFEVVNASIRSLLNPELTASWEKGLNYVAEGSITSGEYMEKLEHFIRSRTDGVLRLNNQYALNERFREAAAYYPEGQRGGTAT